MINHEFGPYLRELRKKKGMTVAELAKKSNVSQSYLTNVENKKRGVPSPDILKRLYIHLDVEYLELMKAAGYISSNTSDISLLVSSPENLYIYLDELEAIFTDQTGKFVANVLEDVKEVMFSSRWYFYNGARSLCLSMGDDKEAEQRLKKLISLPKSPYRDFDEDTFFNEVVSLTPKFLFDVLSREELIEPDEDTYSEFSKILISLSQIALSTEKGDDNEQVLNFLRDQKIIVDIEEFLQKKYIRYQNKRISEQDRERILEMLQVLFSIRK
ncbi:helix-turn-helix domain-containing protein [Paenibacillus sp. AR247]|uniref:helix-turn-helix domain-containing protein n=1 Tax=Paenibacillus sp. AR247 TaxID=1631599 RepID=UPI000CF9716E|nr:helix-turn-helix transcriptional regulator [Paenibacillus sp. AR247]PQP89680.1 hypothetical protein CPT76_16935 [Paenibacillus sp. AR247]